MKKISKLTVITTLITLLPIVLGIALYDRLPDVVATHWGIDNQPNGWSSKAMAAFGMPGILALINLVCSIAMEIYPDSPFVKVRPVSIKAVGGREKENKLADKVSPRLMWLCRWIIPVLSLILVPVMLYSAMGVSFDMGRSSMQHTRHNVHNNRKLPAKVQAQRRCGHKDTMDAELRRKLG